MATGFLTTQGNSIFADLAGGLGEISYVRAEAYAFAFADENEYTTTSPTPVLNTTVIAYGSNGTYANIDVGFDLSQVLTPATSIKSVMLFASMSHLGIETPYKLINIAEVPITSGVGAVYTLALRDFFTSKFLDMIPSVEIGTPIAHQTDNRRHNLQQINNDPEDILVHSTGTTSVNLGDIFTFVPRIDIIGQGSIRFEKGFMATLTQRDISGEVENLYMKSGNLYVITLTPEGFTYFNNSPFKRFNGTMGIFDGYGWKNVLPVGLVCIWNSLTEPHWGYFLNGKTIPMKDNEDLAQFLGYGTSVPYFQLPDYRGRTIAGYNPSSGGVVDNGRIPAQILNGYGGVYQKTLTSPAHTHGFSASVSGTMRATREGDGSVINNPLMVIAMDNPWFNFGGGAFPFQTGGTGITGPGIGTAHWSSVGQDWGGTFPSSSLSFGARLGRLSFQNMAISGTVASSGSNAAQDITNPYVASNLVIVHGRV